MPPVTRWFIKAGMIYFIAGVLLALVSELNVIPWNISLLPVYWHMLVMGWFTQVIMGVSIWMFPRRKRDRKKIQSMEALFTFWLLNTGLILRFITEPFLPVLNNGIAADTVISVSALLQISAVILYTMEVWPRLRPKK
jgi:hypothetical protein